VDANEDAGDANELVKMLSERWELDGEGVG
jgi:hypothetical protein